ncbi:MAG TPA: 7-cyano-7-deazaguanine synthase QueC [bacterium]|nr:7-cyano-7-deazaguanine synthase QueC [bacterium]
MKQKGDRPKTALVLLSGGIDSATTLAIACRDFRQVDALSFRYGQRHFHELKAARKIAAAGKIRCHQILDIPLEKIGGSALTADIPVPKDRRRESGGSRIPVTYVPARNLIFLSLALAWAETRNIFDIFIGVNHMDYSGYPDCRPAFIETFERTANLATRAGMKSGRFRVHAPLMDLSKADIIHQGAALGVDFRKTHSCYDPTAAGLACGRCDSCRIRRKGFQESGITDPTEYAGEQPAH